MLLLTKLPPAAVCRTGVRKLRLSVSEQKNCCVYCACRKLAFALSILIAAPLAEAQVPKADVSMVISGPMVTPVSSMIFGTEATL